MRFVADAGCWSSGPAPEPPPLVAVVEISGAVLSWTPDDPSHTPRLAFTDPLRADWLWRVVGERGHVAIATALGRATASDGAVVEVDDVELPAEALEPLRRLALGH